MMPNTLSIFSWSIPLNTTSIRKLGCGILKRHKLRQISKWGLGIHTEYANDIGVL